MVSTRHSLPGWGDFARLEAQLAAGKQVTAQWSGPLPDQSELAEVDRLCASYGTLLEVRFFGCYTDQGYFDAALLRHVPNVARLTLNCLTFVDNLDVVRELPALEQFQFGAYDQPDGRFIADLPLEQLTRLDLEGNKKRNFELKPLTRCAQLERLMIEGHSRTLEAIAELPRLAELILRGIPKTRSLEPVNAIPKLRRLHLQLGSRASIAEMAHPTLARLTVDWVRGLESVGDLARFPGLRELIVEDQLQIGALDLSPVSLTGLRVTNCKSLTDLRGLERQHQLEWFHASRTRLDLDGLRDFAWPLSIKSVGLFSGSRKWNDATKAHFAARGITQFADEVLA